MFGFFSCCNSDATAENKIQDAVYKEIVDQDNTGAAEEKKQQEEESKEEAYNDPTAVTAQKHIFVQQDKYIAVPLNAAPEVYPIILGIGCASLTLKMSKFGDAYKLIFPTLLIQYINQAIPAETGAEVRANIYAQQLNRLLDINDYTVYKELILDNKRLKNSPYFLQYRAPVAIETHFKSDDIDSQYQSVAFPMHGEVLCDLMTFINFSLENGFDKKPGRFGDIFFSLLYQIYSCLASLHQESISHCDLKFENIFLSPDGQIYLGDLETMVETEQNGRCETTIQGTKQYWAPEYALANAKNTNTFSGNVKAVDIWAIAAAINYALSTIETGPKELGTDIAKRPSLKTLQRVIRSSLQTEPSNRITAKQAFEFFKQDKNIQSKVPLKELEINAIKDYRRQYVQREMRDRKNILQGLSFKMGVIL